MKAAPIRFAATLIGLVLLLSATQGCYRQWSRSSETTIENTPSGKVERTKTKRSSSGSWMPEAIQDEEDERNDRDFY